MSMESELLARVERWAKESPSKTMLTFVDDKGTASTSLTCGDLHRRMQNLAALLLAAPSQHPKGLGLKPGDRVLLVYPPGLEFIVAFLACLRAGVVAVPVYPPDPRKMKKDISMFIAVAQNSQARVALTCGMYYHVKKIAGIKQKLTFSAALPWPEHLSWVITDDLVETRNLAESKLWLVPQDAPHASDVAFLQYTSGSTSAPKGVMLTHGNLTHNLRTISSALVASRDTVVVSWLPQYHDMGLIGAYLGIIFNGGTGVYMSPFSFIRDPMLWMRLISQHGATHLQAPNFAYALCARKADALMRTSDNVDLSSVRHMINGAEPIQGDAMDAFYHAFAPYGLPPDVVKPTYGLAEHTVYVCGGGQQRLWVDKAALEHDSVFQPAANQKPSAAAISQGEVKEMIGCGVPSSRDHGIDLRIVDPETSQEQAEGRVGEIWITSGSKAMGYYGVEMKELSQAAFHATLKSSAGSNDDEQQPRRAEYLRTGDFGVIYQQELFICGRMKDLVIIRGRNHYPQDLEATAEAYDELRPGCSAAFSFSTSNGDSGDAEKLALVAELRDADSRQKASLCAKIRSAISREHGVKVTLIVLLKPRSIPKTTSGKISRARTKKALEDNQLEVLYRNEDMIGDVSEVDGNEDSSESETATAAVEAVDMSMDRSVNDTTVRPGTTGASDGGGGHAKAFTEEPPEQVYAFLLKELAQLLDVNTRVINANTPLQEIGMDSMALTQLQGIITQRYGVHVAEEILYGEATSLTSLHATLCGADKNGASPSMTDQNARLVDGPGGGSKPKLICGCIAC